MKPEAPIAVSEWSAVSVAGILDSDQRDALCEAAEAWRISNALSSSPLSFSGPHGELLCAAQYVGVVEVPGASVEIYPKLDEHFLDGGQIISPQQTGAVMHNLLWMLEAAGYMDISEVDTAHLEEHPVTFYDVFAYLMARNLLQELQAGVPHAYRTMRNAVPAVRGRINILEQITTQWNRMDRIACIWDEFTPNIPVNRLFKCACRVLNVRVSNPVVARLLSDCLVYFDSVEDVDPKTALMDVQFFRWDRSNDRLKTSFDMALRLLAGTGYSLGTGGAETFVFLVDMNSLFEAYAGAVLESAFGVPIEQQAYVGTLFRVPEKVRQYPDYVWASGDERWIADAKYKHLAKGQQNSLRFESIIAEEAEDGAGDLYAHRVVNTNDIRQLTVYAELLRKREETPPNIMIVYPFVGNGIFEVAEATAWNTSRFSLIPIRVVRQESLRNALALKQTKS